jgi:tetratricopeptide (TPR) repeat protein
MSPPPDAWVPDPEAIAAFDTFLAALSSVGQADFELFVDGHAALASDLRRLMAEFRQVQVLLDDRAPLAIAGASPVELQQDLAELQRFCPPTGRYSGMTLIDAGGMGEVHRVWDAVLRRHVAMKVITSERLRSPRDVFRFLSEARTLGRLDHPGIVPLHDVGLTTEGRPFFTMPIIEGQNLGQLLDQGEEAWPLSRSLQSLVAASRAVAHAHSRGIVHRDLKPANIMVGRFDTTLVLDWGLAKSADSAAGRSTIAGDGAGSTAADEPSGAAAAQLTAAGSAVGTAPYMSPEQAEGRRDAVGTPTDVYALGAILYRILAKQEPYVAKGERVSRTEIVRRVCNGPPAPLQGVAFGSPRELIAICERAMSRSIADRYSDALQLGDDLQAYLDGREGRAWKDSPAVRLTKWARRKPARAVGIALGIIVGSLAIVTVSTWKLSEERAQRLDEATLRIAARELAETVQELMETELPVQAMRNGEVDRAALATSMIDGYRAAGIDFASDQAPSEAERLLSMTTSADDRNTIRNGLRRTASYLVAVGAAPSPKGAAHASDPLNRAWDELVPVVDRIETDPWRRRTWEASLDLWLRGENHVPALVDECREQGTAKNDIMLVYDLAREVGMTGDDLRWLVEFAVERDDGDFWAQFYLAALSVEPQQRWLHSELAAALQPRSIPARFNLGWNYQNAGSAEDRQRNQPLAIEAYEQALALDPTLTNAYCNLSRMLPPAEAVSLLELAMKRAPPNEILYEALAEAHNLNHDLPRAVRIATDGLDAYPESIPLLFNLSQYYGYSGDLDTQITTLRRLLPLAPEHPDVLANLGAALLTKSDDATLNPEAARKMREEALVLLEREFSLRPDNPATVTRLAEAHEALGHYLESIRLFGKAAVLETTN